jgi:exodeoxyribonuclease VII small subunit
MTNASTSPTQPAPSVTSVASDELAKRTFEDLVGELETVAAAMDRGDIGIEEAADLYSRAAALHAAAHDRLTAVQARLATLRSTTSA